MKTSCIYCRVSSTSDRQNVDRQISDLKLFALKNDFDVVRIFAENISGAKTNEERAILTECVNFCLENDIDTMLTSELSRIGRDTLQVLRTLDILNKNKVNVYIQNLNINTLNEDKEINPIGSILITILAEMAKIERSSIAYRLNSGRENYIKAGGRLGRSKGSIKPLETKKEEYKEVLSLLKRDYSIRNVAKLTNTSVSTVQRLKKEFDI